MDKKFMTYLENIISLEKTAYMQTEIIDKLDREIQSLGRPQWISEPREANTDFAERFIGIGVFTVLGGAAIFGFQGLFDSFISGAIGGILKGGLIGLVFAILIALVPYSIEKSEKHSQYEQRLAQYYSEKSADDRRVQEEKKRAERLKSLKSATIAKQKETKNLLREYYDVGMIYPKYQNMVAVCSIYEYFQCGVCDRLTGHEGAYNKFDSEILLNRIICKMDDILKSLDSIKNNQYMLYSAIQNGNQNVQRLISKTDEQTRLLGFVADNTELAAYNAQQAVEEARFGNWLTTYDMMTRR